MSGKAIVAISFLLFFMFHGTVGTSYVYGAVPPKERGALIALYKSMDGDNWEDNSGWKTPPVHADGFAMPGTERYWTGVTCNPENTMVVEIDLSDNRLRGTIPPELGDLSCLNYLYLNSNQLEGKIPPELENLSWLSELVLHSNQLTGGIPAELGELSRLMALDLSNNQLTGNIPPELGNLSLLNELDLGYNRLTGTIPPQLGNISGLCRLQLGYNQLTGSILPELGQLSIIYSLGLEYNRLTGRIPPELGTMFGIIFLDLENNRLTGSIPPELGNLIYLNRITLSSNRLIGGIPRDLKNLILLKTGARSDFRYNGLYTGDESLRTFLNQGQEGGNGESTQTIAPEYTAVRTTSATSVEISWKPIAYTGDEGGYRVFYSLTPGGPYTLFDTTTTKYDYRMEIRGLQPSTKYYFVVQTRTKPHVKNQNTVDSEYSSEVQAQTPDSDKIISGRVATETGKGVDGVWLIFSPSNTFAVTDSSGNYSHVVNLGWTGTVLPLKTGYFFSPNIKVFQNVTNDLPGNDFIASLFNFYISGKVTSLGEGVEGVTLTFVSNSGGTGSVKTEPDGSYFHPVPNGWTGRVTPSKGDLRFYPTFTDYVLPGVRENREQDYKLSVSLDLNATRKYDSTLIIRKEYGEIELNVDLVGISTDEVQTFIIYRKEHRGTFQLNKSFSFDDSTITRFTYRDEYLDKGIEYTYISRAVNAQGEIIGESKEKSI